MLELHEAQQKIISAIDPLPSENIPLLDASDRFLAEDVLSPIDLPPFDNSSMDGYAVVATDVLSAKREEPVRLRVIGKVAAGAMFDGKVSAGMCVRLFTGSPLPSGADAVVMQEDTEQDPSDPEWIRITDTAKPWENVRFRGEDIKQGSVVAQKGEKLSAARLSVISAVGRGTVRVSRKPVIGLLATGSELVEAGQTFGTGQIYESNRVGLAALCQKCGATPKIYPIVRDDLDATSAAFAKALQECDAIITSGGVSVGEFDFVKAAFEQLGGQLDFWKVSVKPGKPFVFGQLSRKFLFGLPGNPVSGFVTFFLLVRPALLKMQGAGDLSATTQQARLSEPLVNRGDRPHYMRVFVDAWGEARSSGMQASHVLRSLSDSNGLVCVPPNTALASGETVSVLRWD